MRKLVCILLRTTRFPDWINQTRMTNTRVQNAPVLYRGADKSLARPGRKQATFPLT